MLLKSKFLLSKERAFSLLEILMAVLILTICIVSALKLNVSSFFSSRKSLILSREVELATNLVEKLFSVSYDNLEEICSEEIGAVLLDNNIYYVNCHVIFDNSNLFKVIVINVSSNFSTNYNIIFYRINEG